MEKTRVTKPTHQEIEACYGDGVAMANMAERMYEWEKQDEADRDAEMVAQHETEVAAYRKEQLRLMSLGDFKLAELGMHYCANCDHVHERDYSQAWSSNRRQVGEGKFCAPKEDRKWR